MNPLPAEKKTIGILVHTPVADDPRVRRQVEAFCAAGWSVQAFGAAGSRSKMPPGDVHEVKLPVANRSASARLRRLAVLSQLKIMPLAAESVFWRLPEQYKLILQAARKCQPDLWIANDWTMLPVVTALTREHPAPFIYDTHEFAFDEFPDNWKWRTFVRPLVRSIEAKGIAMAAHVSCVSSGIATRLQNVYGLRETPTVIRNLPLFQDPPFRATGARVRVLYHGIVTPQRGLEETIRSVASWRPEFNFTIRGPGQHAYLEQLKVLAAESGVADRVTFAPPVPFTELVTSAAAYDIGLFVLPANSAQNEYVLPNKLFEYIMAGLAICVSDVPEMSAIVTRYKSGSLVSGLDLAAIAQSINRFDRDLVDQCKANSIAARQELCWEREKPKLLDIAEQVLLKRAQANHSAASA